MSPPVAGWYADPRPDADGLRYWDGAGWTDHVRAFPDPPAQVVGDSGRSPLAQAPTGSAVADGHRSRTVWDVVRHPSFLSIASIVAAIAGVAVFWWNGVGGVLGVGALVLAVLALRSSGEPTAAQRALSTSAITLGSLAASLTIALLLFGGLVSSAFDDGFSDLESDLESDLPQIDSDPPDGECDPSRFLEDPDC